MTKIFWDKWGQPGHRGVNLVIYYLTLSEKSFALTQNLLILLSPSPGRFLQHSGYHLYIYYLMDNETVFLL